MVGSDNREASRAAFELMDAVLQAHHEGGSEQTKSDRLYWLEFSAQLKNSADAFFGESALAVAEAGNFEGQQFLSGAAYAAFVGGTSVSEAHRVLETASSLREFPQLRDDFAAGLISSEKTRLIVDAAVVEPDALSDLMDLAREDTTARLAKESRRIRAAAAEPKSAEEAEKKVHFKTKASDPFGHKVNGYMTNEMIASMQSHLTPLTNSKCRDAQRSGTFVSHNHCQAHALVELCSQSSTGKSPRPHINFTVSLEGLENSKLRLGELCEIPGVGPVPLSRIKQLLDDAYLSLILQGSGSQVTPGRYVNRDLQRKLDVNGRSCTMRGCDNDAHLARDHNIEMRDGGRTHVGNLADLCAPHHSFKTKYRMKLVGDPGRKQMVTLSPHEMWGQSRAGP